MKHLMLTMCVFCMAVSMAEAACRWEWDCSQSPCRQVPICDNTLEIPPIRPLEIQPNVLPPVRPIDPMVIPPIGTSQCRQEYLCNANGQCRWQTVCR